MKYAVFFDWDGTLSHDGIHISDVNREAIRQLQREGHLAFLCTGRSFAFVPEEARNFGFNGIVCGAGTHVIVGDETIFSISIPEEVTKKILLHFLQDGQACVLEGEEAMFLINEWDSSRLQWPQLKKPEDFNRFVKGHPITKLTMYGKPSGRTIQLLSEYFSLIVHPNYCEAVLKGCNKATGIEKMLNYFGMSRQSSVGIGDSPNDLDMLKYTATSIVVENAPEEVRQAADKITCRSEDNGVAEALKQWILKGEHS